MTGDKPPFPKQQQETPGAETAMAPRADHGEQTYRGYGRLRNRVAIITAGDSGIGLAVALAYARAAPTSPWRVWTSTRLRRRRGG